jgi:hypothetical protein
LDLGASNVDLGTWSPEGLITVGDLAGGWIVRVMGGIMNGSSVCPKAGVDDQLAYCPN